MPLTTSSARNNDEINRFSTLLAGNPHDMELHNIVVSTRPIQTFLVDFESSERAFSGSDKSWEQRRSGDLFELARLAVYLQCGIGTQQGSLARKSLEDLSKLFDDVSTSAARLDAADRKAVSRQIN